MLRRLLIAPVVAAALLAVLATPAAGVAKDTATVKVADCSIESASALFVARMRQVSGSSRMALRFKLFERSDEGFRPISAPGLGRWRRSKPEVGAFSYKQVVRGLQAGTLYRVQVDFRWFDEAGAVISTARRRSAPCAQYDVLPNLTATPVDTRLGAGPGVLRYRVLVTNEGIAPATGVPVRLAVDGAAVDTMVVPTLAPAERRVLVFQGPACESSVEAAADPDGVIVESSETDNAHKVDCSALR
jgi:hypothetical protein